MDAPGAAAASEYDAVVLRRVDGVPDDVTTLVSVERRLQRRDARRGVRISVMRQNFPGYEVFDELERLSRGNVVAVDHLTFAERSLEGDIPADDVVVNVLGKDSGIG